MHKHEWRLIRATKMINQRPTTEYGCRTCGDVYVTHTGEEPSVLREDTMAIPKLHVKKGDIVRVVLEGEVKNVTESSFLIGDDISYSNRIWNNSNHVMKAEVIRHSYSVGDRLDRNELARWNPPSGTVVSHEPSMAGIARRWMKLNESERWVDQRGIFDMIAAMPNTYYTIEVIA
jgi:hypothetical protein